MILVIYYTSYDNSNTLFVVLYTPISNHIRTPIHRLIHPMTSKYCLLNFCVRSSSASTDIIWWGSSTTYYFTSSISNIFTASSLHSCNTTPPSIYSTLSHHHDCAWSAYHEPCWILNSANRWERFNWKVMTSSPRQLLDLALPAVDILVHITHSSIE